MHAGPATTIGEDRSLRSLRTASGDDRGARRLAWSLWLLTVLLLALGGWLEVLNAPARGSPWQLGINPSRMTATSRNCRRPRQHARTP